MAVAIFASSLAASKRRVRRTQRERSETTTAHLVGAARTLFAERGYADTSLDQVVDAAGVTKGALYHHFGNKRDLFEAVFREEERRVRDAVAAVVARRHDPRAGLYAGCRAFLDACIDPGVQRITLLDAPSVLGRERMREIELEHALALIQAGLAAATASDGAGRRDLEPPAYLLFGALGEAAMFIARADDQAAAKRKCERELKALLDGLLP
jgi:AcrR family transcriptional regulator